MKILSYRHKLNLLDADVHPVFSMGGEGLSLSLYGLI